jgi:hypothetical protein
MTWTVPVRPRTPTPDERGRESWRVNLRRAVVALVALLIAVQVVRNAAVLALESPNPAAADRLWKDHPRATISLAMMEIARSAHDRRPISASVFAALDGAALRAPLAPEPFLVRGVQAQLAGDGGSAEKAFEAAQWRDPRSLPAAYFLADRYVRSGEAARGLRQLGALARLSPNGHLIVAPYLAAYAQSPANWPALRTLFRANPELAGPALAALADHRATVPAVLALASNNETETSWWLPRLLTTLTAAGEYDQARAIWAKASHVRPGPSELIYDRSFSDAKAAAPFNWTLTSSTLGLAERQAGGRLHVLYYGHDDGFLATQLLVLPRGKYRLSMKLVGDPSRARLLNWSVWCDKGSAPLASVTLDSAAARGWTFEVPQDCAAQWLKLGGSAAEISQPSDVTISDLKLERGGQG